jgi:L-iditol 2-dehydrogenase
MQAALYLGPGKVEISERPDPEPRPDNLVVEVACCAICGSDLKLATIGHPRWKPPVIIGHEFAGRVRHVGAQVEGFATGDRVTMATTVGCNRCPICARGLQNMCPNSRAISQVCDGAFAPLLAIPPLALAGGNVIKVPHSVSDEAAALGEPISCAINAQQIIGVRPGDRVLVIGGGPLGAIHAEVARAMGASKVMIVQRSEPRLSLLKRLAGLVVIDGAREDVGERVLSETDGLGADAVIVCAPERLAQEQSLRYARKGAGVSLFASLASGASEVTFDSRAIHYNELRVAGASDSRPEHVQKAMDLLAAGKIDARGLVTHELPLSRFLEGIDLMKRKESLKVLMRPGRAG